MTMTLDMRHPLELVRRVYRRHAKTRLRPHGASIPLAGPSYRGGAGTAMTHSWVDIKAFVPGTQSDPCRGLLSPQSARSDVGRAANAAPMANAAAAAITI